MLDFITDLDEEEIGWIDGVGELWSTEPDISVIVSASVDEDCSNGEPLDGDDKDCSVPCTLSFAIL